jgi:hypothetical protein
VFRGCRSAQVAAAAEITIRMLPDAPKNKSSKKKTALFRDVDPVLPLGRVDAAETEDLLRCLAPTA